MREGRIAAVGANASGAPANAVRVDAGGRTVMPGFIDAHRHIIQGDPARWLAEQSAANMREFLEAGFTTVFSAIDAPTRSSSCAAARKAARRSGRASSPRRSCHCRAPRSAAAASIPRARTRRAHRTGPARPLPAFRAADTLAAVRAAATRGHRRYQDADHRDARRPRAGDAEAHRRRGGAPGPLEHHARRIRHRHRRGRRGRHGHSRAHAAHRAARRSDGEEDRRREHSDGLDARRVRALLQRRQHAAVPRPPAVSVRDVVERGPRPRERPAAVPSRHHVCLRHGYELVAARLAASTSCGRCISCSRTRT